MKKAIKWLLNRLGYQVTRVGTVASHRHYGLDDFLSEMKLAKDAVVIHGGANEGESIRRFPGQSDTLRVYSFEPDLAPAEQLGGEFEDCDHIKIREYKLTERATTLNFNLTKCPN